jgi:MFS family permease
MSSLNIYMYYALEILGENTHMGTQSAGIEKALIALYVMNFLTSIGFGAFGVIVPLYMLNVGVSLSGLGLAFGAFGIVVGIAGMFFGAHSDIVGRKPYLILSLLLRAIMILFYTQARGIVDFVIIQALTGVSNALSGVTVPALMADLTKDVERGRKFGRLGGFGWLGTGSGYFIGGVLSQIFGYYVSFVFVSMLTFISCIIILAFVPSYRLVSRERFSFGLVRGFSHNLKIWLLISFLTALVIGPVEAMVIPAYAVSPGPLGIDNIIFGSIMSASYILTSSTQFIGGSLADKYSRKKLSVIFFLLSAPFILVQPLYQSFIFFAAMYFLEGIGEGLNHPCNNAIVAASARSEHRGFDFSIVNLLGNIGSVIGFVGIGLILETFGFTIPFIIRAVAYVLAAMLVFILLKDQTQPSKKGHVMRV